MSLDQSIYLLGRIPSPSDLAIQRPSAKWRRHLQRASASALENLWDVLHKCQGSGRRHGCVACTLVVLVQSSPSRSIACARLSVLPCPTAYVVYVPLHLTLRICCFHVRVSVMRDCAVYSSSLQAPCCTGRRARQNICSREKSYLAQVLRKCVPYQAQANPDGQGA